MNYALMIRTAALLVCGLVASFSVSADVDSARSRGAAWLIKQQRGDGSWASADGRLPVQATASALAAINNAGLLRSPTFSAAGAWLANADADSVDSLARKVEGLMAAGLTTTAQIEADRLFSLRTLASEATWSGYGGGGLDYIDTALGLTGLRLGDSGYIAKVAATPNTIANALCSLSAGRVNVAAGKRAWPSTQAATAQSAAQGRPSVLASALLLQELTVMQARLGNYAPPCSAAPFSLASLRAEGQAWLLDQQNADGGFGEQRTDGSKGRSTVLLSATVLRLLNSQASVPQPQTGNLQAWLLGQQDGASGSWRNDPLVTAAVVFALPAASGAQLTDSDRDGITDVVELALSGANSQVADARNQLTAPSLSVAGQTASGFAVAATLGQTFDYSLTGSGAYSIAAGNLPPGLSLNASSGRITGMPIRLGSFSFDYRAGGAAAQIGRIDVAEAAAPMADVPLPPWVLAVLVSLFGASAGWRRWKSSCAPRVAPRVKACQ